MIRYLENMEREIIIRNSLSEIAKITQFIEELSLSLQLSSCVTMSINLAIEEAVINIINHAYPANESGEIIRIDVLSRQEATMKTNLCKIEDVTVLAIEGRLDTINANDFNAVIQPLLADTTPNIIINCEGMTYISSSGLRSFIILQKSVSQHNGCLAVEAVQPEIRKIFDMTGCSSLFTIR